MKNLTINHPLSQFLREFDMAPPSFGVAPAGFRVDIEEDEKQYRLHADLPGAEKSDVSISVEDNVLTVAANIGRKSENAVRTETVRGELSRAFLLPRLVDSKNIAASMKNGVLTVVLPKAEAAGRKIEIH